MRITKLIAAFLGVLMVIGSFAITVAGGIALAVPDEDGWVSAGPIRMRTEAVGFVGEDIEIDFGDHANRRGTFIGWDAIPARFEIDSRNDKTVFVGIAGAADARAYLNGVAVDRVESWDHDPELVSVPGALSIAPPESQDIWVASNEAGDLEWDISDGDWAIVVLNADGTPGVDVGVTGSARIPFLRTLGVVLIAAGLIGMSVGGLLTYYGVRRVREARPVTAPPTQPVAAG
jgi:hypothetical protein